MDRLTEALVIAKPIQSQKLITKDDNASIAVGAVAYYRVQDPIRLVISIEAGEEAMAQTSLCSLLGLRTLAEALSETDSINRDIKEILDVQIDAWCTEVVIVNSRDMQAASTALPVAACNGDSK